MSLSIFLSPHCFCFRIESVQQYRLLFYEIGVVCSIRNISIQAIESDGMNPRTIQMDVSFYDIIYVKVFNKRQRTRQHRSLRFEAKHVWKMLRSVWVFSFGSSNKNHLFNSNQYNDNHVETVLLVWCTRRVLTWAENHLLHIMCWLNLLSQHLIWMILFDCLHNGKEK